MVHKAITIIEMISMHRQSNRPIGRYDGDEGEPRIGNFAELVDVPVKRKIKDFFVSLEQEKNRNDDSASNP